MHECHNTELHNLKHQPFHGLYIHKHQQDARLVEITVYATRLQAAKQA